MSTFSACLTELKSNISSTPQPAERSTTTSVPLDPATKKYVESNFSLGGAKQQVDEFQLPEVAGGFSAMQINNSSRFVSSRALVILLVFLQMLFRADNWLNSFFNSRTAIAGAIIGLLFVFYNSKNLNCIGALSFFYDSKRSIGFLSVFFYRK